MNPLMMAQYQAYQAKKYSLVQEEVVLAPPYVLSLKGLLRNALTAVSTCPLWLSSAAKADDTATSQGQPIQLRMAVAHSTGHWP